ncbi:redoxin family protein [bacterium]|nr:redoxin family protein [bacterium]
MFQKNEVYHYRALAFIVFILFLSGCIEQDPPEQTQTNTSSAKWANIELTDVVTGQKFNISDFSGQSVLLESFAVWCPTCLQQQKEINNFIKTGNTDDVVHISIDTDPEEDESAVLRHIQENDFEWRFAVSPIEFTRELISDFGLGVIDAPGAPIVLICPDGSSRLLSRGVKSAEKLKSEIDKWC